MSDIISSQERLQLEADARRLKVISAFYRKMVKEFNVQSKLSIGPPNYSMTLYFQSHLEDEADFYTRVQSILENRIFEIENDEG